MTISVGAAIVASLDPLLMRTLIDVSLPHRQFAKSFVLIVLLALCFVGRIWMGGWSALLTFRVTQGFGQDLRRELLAHISGLSLDWHERVPLGEKLSRFDQDAEVVAQFSSDFVNTIVRTLTLFVLNLCIMLYLNWRMTLVVLVLLPLFVWLRARFKLQMEVKAHTAQSIVGRASSVLAEHVAAVPQIQLLTSEASQILRVSDMWQRMCDARHTQRRTEVLYSLSVTSILALAILLVLGSGIWEFRAGMLTLGGLVAFYAYVTRIFEPVSSAMEMYSRVQRITASVRRIQEILTLRPSVLDHGTLSTLSSYDLRCSHVSYSYAEGDSRLIDVSLTVDSGERIALIGKSGSGKSTLSRLLVRLADPTSGEITLGGRSLEQYSLNTLRRVVCYVPQAPMLFSGSIDENLRFGNPTATDREIDQAIEAAGLGELLRRLPQGLHTTLGPNATGLSGGEQQRLALARSILRKSEVLILDESTSALDLATESIVLSSIARLPAIRSLVLVTHRIRSVTWVDKVVLLDTGRVSAEGTSAKLYATSPLYRDLFNSAPIGAGRQRTLRPLAF